MVMCISATWRCTVISWKEVMPAKSDEVDEVMTSHRVGFHFGPEKGDFCLVSCRWQTNHPMIDSVRVCSLRFAPEFALAKS